ncbi:phosphatase PAP2 family protein [Paenarthrobacter aurescens]|nr:phosphatase PAP2 family protein [Paenarthrobacter aurescens]MDO6141668.1 phosphatase PAP2 family protein [Paenarthrobacter aurescens]MDO6149431.1 phosphatase PAP2 family protein [Paenarthrobacter aurescens]MDO6156717.1 phosphatase PAP2 family protein [Paenarthrobacter aurescens]MDO6160703.1 phosphatase PAP2 family protein [Paenarthrobacter aurescens]
MIRVLRPQPRPGWQLITPGILLLCAFAVPGALIMAGQGEPAFNRVDTGWQSYVFSMRSTFWDGVNVVLNWAGYAGMLAFHAVLAVSLVIWQRPKAAIFAATSGILVLALTQLAKAVVGRDRPEGARVLSDTGSYPSGHVSATTAFLLVLALLMGRWWMGLIAAVGVVSMMISRTYLSAHWLSDVLGGACLAAGVVLLMWWRFRDICIKENDLAGGQTIWSAKALRRRQAAEQAK